MVNSEWRDRIRAPVHFVIVTRRRRLKRGVHVVKRVYLGKRGVVALPWQGCEKNRTAVNAPVSYRTGSGSDRTHAAASIRSKEKPFPAPCALVWRYFQHNSSFEDPVS